MEQLKQQLSNAGIDYREKEPLSAHCTFRIGGPADLFIRPRDNDALCRAITLCEENGVK